MSVQAPSEPNVRQAVPFFMVTDLAKSLRHYVDGLGFVMTNQWVDQGKLAWCWLELGGAALMLQELRKPPESKLGVGVSVSFMCKDALAIYREIKGRGISARRPFVGNGLWVASVTDPDGYKVDFQSPTDVPEDTELPEES